MNKVELQEKTGKLNEVYTKKTGNRLIFREVLNKWYLCEIVPLGEKTLYSGTLDECMEYADKLVI